MGHRTRAASGRRRRGKRRRFDAPLTIALTLAIVLAMFGVYSLTHCGHGGDRVEIPDWIKVDLIQVNEYSRPGTKLRKINGVVIHYVGNPGTTAEQNRNYFNNLASTHETSASAHFVVGLDGEIIQCVPLTEIAYCSSSRNVDTVSIEACHPDASGKFNDETMDSVVRLTAWLCEEFDLTTDDVIRHYDVTGKLCPLYYVEHPDAWEKLLDDVDARIIEDENSVEK